MDQKKKHIETMYGHGLFFCDSKSMHFSAVQYISSK